MNKETTSKVRIELTPKQAKALEPLFNELAVTSGLVIIGQAWWGTKTIKPHVIFKCLTLNEVIEAAEKAVMDGPREAEQP